MTIVQNPRQFKVPDWMLNRKKDNKDGKFSQVVSNTLDMKLREDLERLKKIRAHRGLRHYCKLLLLVTCAHVVFCSHAMPLCVLCTCLTASVGIVLQGVFVFAASTQRPRAPRAAPSVSPRRRVRCATSSSILLWRCCVPSIVISGMHA